MEVAILKQRIAHNHLPNSFDSLEIPELVSLNTITDQNARQRLTDRCAKILQRTKSDMMAVHIAFAEAKMEEYRKKFDTDMAQMNEIQRVGPTHKKLTRTMMAIIERRFKTINEHLLCLYKIKLRFFVKAPAVKN